MPGSVVPLSGWQGQGKAAPGRLPVVGEEKTGLLSLQGDFQEEKGRSKSGNSLF
jgi:hypothetical protein